MLIVDNNNGDSLLVKALNSSDYMLISAKSNQDFSYPTEYKPIKCCYKVSVSYSTPKFRLHHSLD